MPYAQRGARLWYDVRGDGEPVLFITGFAISAAIFDPVLPRYAERFRCIVYDNRGAGRSPAPPALTSMPQLAGDAVELLDELGIEAAHVYGVSMGGMIAQELAIRFPHRVRGLVLGCTTPGGPRAVRPAVRELGSLGANIVGAARRKGRPWLAAALFSERFRREQPERVNELLANFARYRATPHGANAHWWATVYHDTFSRLGCIQAPTLVMHGSEDAMSPLRNAELLAERIPDAELVVVPGSGHAYALERPEPAYDAFADWIDRRSPIAPGDPPRGIDRMAEPVTRALGLPVGMARTGRSLAHQVTARARRSLVRGRRARA